MTSYRLLFILNFIFCLLMASPGWAQNLDSRVGALEDYVETFQPTLLELSTSLQDNMRLTTKEIMNALEATQEGLIIRVDNQLKDLNTKTIIIDPHNPAFQSIQTNVGLLLVSVERLEQTETGGHRLILNVGNPNYVDLKGFKVRLIWGLKHFPGLNSRDEWRNSLKGAEYTYGGVLKRGYWNQVVIEVDEADSNNFGHVEFELEILSAQLEFS